MCLSFLNCSAYVAEQLGGATKLFCSVDAFGEEKASEHRLTGVIVLLGKPNPTPYPKT